MRVNGSAPRERAVPQVVPRGARGAAAAAAPAAAMSVVSAAVMVAASAGAARAQAPSRTPVPAFAAGVAGANSANGAAGAARDTAGLPKLAFEKYTLPNGLEVILHEDHSVPLVAVDTWFKVGSGNEQPGRTGFAHLFEHVMFTGSEHVPAGAFDQWLEAAGAADNNGSTSPDRTNYYEIMPSNALPLALWLDADRMGFLLPTMDRAKLDLQRDVVKNERRERIDNAPYGRADETIAAALFPKAHPYAWPVVGSMADLSAASLDDVKGFFRTYYAPNNATLTIAGDFDRDSVRRWVERYYGDIPRGPEVARPAVPAVALPRDTFLVLEDAVQLPRVYYTWHTPKALSPDDGVLDLLAYVLAGDKNSRLYKSLVYDTQVAQEVNAYQVSGRLDGYFRVDVTPKPGQSPQRVAAMVDAELRRLMDGGVTDRELARAKNTTRANLLDRLASVLGKADQLNFYNYFAGTPDYVQQDAERYARVTADDVRRVARAYLGAPKVVLTVVPQGETKMMVTRRGM
jgi:zinc protease